MDKELFKNKRYMLTADEGRLETPFAMTTFLTVTHYRAIRTVRKTWSQ